MNDRATSARATAITIYIGASLSTSFLVSAIMADIPLMKHCLFIIDLICFIADIVSAEALSFSNCTMSMVAVPSEE